MDSDLDKLDTVREREVSCLVHPTDARVGGKGAAGLPEVAC